MRRIVGVVLGLLDRIAQRVITPLDGQVAWISEPDYAGNAFHLYRHTVTTVPGLTHVHLVTDISTRRRIEDDFRTWSDAVAPGSRLVVRKRHSLRGYVAFLRSARVFHTHGVYRMTTTAHRREMVSLWHGMPIKCIGALNRISTNPHPTFGTTHIATSDFFRYVIAAAFRADVDDVLVAGLPRCDVLQAAHPQAPSRSEIFNALGIPVDSRLVVWMPTYRTSGHLRNATPGVAGFRTFLDDLTEQQWSQVDRLAGESGATVMVKLHPTDPLNGVDYDLDLDNVRLVRSDEWLATGIELYDMLAVSDALMSDISSVLLDYLATDRPVGMIGFDVATYNRDVVFSVDTLLESSRINDLSEDGQLEAFFSLVGSGDGTQIVDDLSPWLHSAETQSGCEAVLRRVGLDSDS